jgi:hypothetical protein
MPGLFPRFSNSGLGIAPAVLDVPAQAHDHASAEPSRTSCESDSSWNT